MLGDKSFSVLAEGLQEALGQLGGDGCREPTERYTAICQYYGMQGIHNNSGRGHENDSVEGAHGHLRRRICQALILRDSNDFNTIEEYQASTTQQVMWHNRNNYDLIKEERLHLKPLPLRRSADCEG